MGGDPQLRPECEDYHEQSSILADPRQRRILSLLLDRSHPMTVRDLGVQLAAQETGKAPSDVTEEDHRSIRVDLHHRCLPKLEAAGWIERHPEGITAAEPLSIEAADSSSLDLQDPAHPYFWEAVGALLARPHRQDIVSIVADQRPRLTLKELATELEASCHASWPTERHDEEPTLSITLHHVDLPRLADVGLIEYDPDEKTITCNRSLTMLVAWPALGSWFTGESDSDHPR